jgi:hypothetical protein
MPTDAFATTAPEGSVTCPRSVPVVTGDVVTGDEELGADDCGCGHADESSGELMSNAEISRARDIVESRASLSFESNAEILIPSMA